MKSIMKWTPILNSLREISMLHAIVLCQADTFKQISTHGPNAEKQRGTFTTYRIPIVHQY